MSEFGPAMGVLLLFFFLPLVDLMSMGVSYGLCIVLNRNQCHEAALEPWQDAQNESGIVKKGIPTQWMNGMGRFTKLQDFPKTEVAYKPGSSTVDGIAEEIVGVRTTITCRPFLNIPLPLVNVPGLNGPMIFQLISESPMENPDYARQK